MEQLQTQEQKHLEFVNLTIKNLIGGHDFIYWEQIASLPMIKADKDWAPYRENLDEGFGDVEIRGKYSFDRQHKELIISVNLHKNSELMNLKLKPVLRKEYRLPVPAEAVKMAEEEIKKQETFEQDQKNNLQAAWQWLEETPESTLTYEQWKQHPLSQLIGGPIDEHHWAEVEYTNENKMRIVILSPSDSGFKKGNVEDVYELERPKNSTSV